MNKCVQVISAIAIALLVAACGSGSAVVPEPDRVATGVAEAKAIAATLTAAAPAIVPTQQVAQIMPTNPSAPTATTEPTAEPPTATALPPTATALLPTLKPTVAAPKPPTPTNTPVPQRADPFVPGGGDPKGLIGRMLLPGYGGAPQVDVPVFSQQIVFRLFVYDPDFGNNDGAGINSVDMQITDPNGLVVQSRTEQNAAYCVFGGGEPDCSVWKFAEHNNQWPNGTPVCRGQGYQAIMTVDAKNDNNDGALWRFNFDIDGNYPQC